MQKDRKTAARSGFQLKVNKITENLENYEEAITQYQDKLRDAKQHLENITKEQAEVDPRLRKLNPRLKLDRLEDRCKSTRFWKRGKDGTLFLSFLRFSQK